MPPKSITSAYLSVRHLAAYSDMSIRTLNLYLRHPINPIPHRKIGGKIYVKKTDFDVWHDGFAVDSKKADLTKIVARLWEN